MDNEWPKVIRDAVREQIDRNNTAIDQACDMMMQHPELDAGVLVQTHANGTVTASLRSSVPFGEVHYVND